MNPMLERGRIQAALNALGVRPNKELGQNFLIDGEVLDQVVAAAELTETDTVVEVGPGLGVLTLELVARAGRVVAVEFDGRLAARLPDAVPSPKLEVIRENILKVNVAKVVGEPYKLVANLPYQITSAILRQFLECRLPPEMAVLMVQWEVAQRIVAQPPDMSVLAHSVQIYAEPEIIARVPGKAFMPAPAVELGDHPLAAPTAAGRARRGYSRAVPHHQGRLFAEPQNAGQRAAPRPGRHGRGPDQARGDGAAGGRRCGARPPGRDADPARVGAGLPGAGGARRRPAQRYGVSAALYTVNGRSSRPRNVKCPFSSVS